jgi:hypothetical protein
MFVRTISVYTNTSGKKSSAAYLSQVWKRIVKILGSEHIYAVRDIT